MKHLETPRTRLRPFGPTDLPLLRLLMTDAEVMKHTGFKGPQPEDVIRQRLQKWSETAGHALGVLCVEEKSGGFVGWFMLQLRDGEDPEIGFMLVKEKWGQGFATEVAREILRHGFQDLKYSRIIAYASPENTASIAVLEKIGMAQMPNLRGPTDTLYFEILREELPEHRG